MRNLIEEFNARVRELPTDSNNRHYYTNGGIADTYVSTITISDNPMTSEDIEDMCDAPLHPNVEDVIGKYEVYTNESVYYLSEDELSRLLRRLLLDIDCFQSIRSGLLNGNVF